MGNTNSTSSLPLERLSKETVSETEELFWASIFDLFSEVEDFHGLIESLDVSYIVSNLPSNIHTLLTRCHQELSSYQSISPFPTKQALGILRFLTSFVPFLHALSFETPSFTDLLLSLCFHPGFTVSSSARLDVFADLIWSTGLWSSNPVSHPSFTDLNRGVVLRCILSFLSCSLYQPDNLFYLDSFKNSQHNLINVFICSLFNTVINFKRGSKFKIFSTFAKDYKPAVFEVSIQLLLILLDFEETAFTSCIKSIQPHDFSFLLSGFLTLFSNPVVTKSETLDESIDVVLDQEALLLFLKIAYIHQEFFSFITSTVALESLLLPLSNIVLDLDNDKLLQNHWLFVYIFLLLSHDRNFSVALSTPLSSPLKIPELPNISGVLGDLFLLVLHKLIARNLKNFELCKGFLVVLHNISPFLKNLHHVVASKYLDLFKFLSSPRFLSVSINNFDLLGLLLKIFSNIVHHQYSFNDHFVYSLLVSEDDFSNLESNLKKDFEAESSVYFKPIENIINGHSFTTISKLIATLGGSLKTISRADEHTPSPKVLRQFIRNFTITGLLPVAVPIEISSFEVNDDLIDWMVKYTWGLVVVNSTVDIFRKDSVKLFE
ncbi:hypothetical protein P9112_004016 [Eukaryota sp. TZLM1-RC]